MNLTERVKYKLKISHTLIITLIVVLILCIFRFIINDQTSLNSQDAKIFEYNAEEFIDSLSYSDYELYSTLFKLESKSDYVLKVTLNSYEQTSRKFNHAIVTIKEVYKGKGLEKNDVIKIKDDVYYESRNDEIIIKSSSYMLPMRDNNEYYVFINKRADYYVYTIKCLSRYNVNKDKIFYVMKNGEIDHKKYDLAIYHEDSEKLRTMLFDDTYQYQEYSSVMTLREYLAHDLYDRYGEEKND